VGLSLPEHTTAAYSQLNYVSSFKCSKWDGTYSMQCKKSQLNLLCAVGSHLQARALSKSASFICKWAKSVLW